MVEELAVVLLVDVEFFEALTLGGFGFSFLMSLRTSFSIGSSLLVTCQRPGREEGP